MVAGNTGQGVRQGGGMNRHCARLLVLLACLLLLPPAARARSWPIRQFEVTVGINEDGSAVLVEEIRFAQPVWDYDRVIPIDSAGPLGARRLQVDVLDVTDAMGKPVAWFTRVRSGYLRIVVPDIPQQAIKISYALRNGVRFLPGHDEFFWQATDARSLTQQARVHVSLPNAASGRFRAQSYLRRADSPRFGAASPASLWSMGGALPAQSGDASVEIGSPGPLVPGVELVLDIFLPTGVIQQRNWLTRAWWFTESNPILLLPVAAFLAMLGLRRLKIVAAADKSVAPKYDPPQGFSPAEVGVLVDDRLTPRDVTATLVDLAVRGYVRIEEARPEHGVLGDRPDYVLRLLRPRQEWHDLAAHEYTMLFHTFYGGQWTKLSSLRLRFYSVVPLMGADVFRALQQKGMYRVSPETARHWRLAPVLLVGALGVAAQAGGLVSMFDSWLLAAAALGASLGIVYAVGKDITAKTVRGLAMLTEIRGFEEFIRTVDEDRIQRLGADLFYKKLPFAIALGIEHHWAQVFQGMCASPPEWYEALVSDTDSGRLGSKLQLFAQATFSILSEAPPRGLHLPSGVSAADDFARGAVGTR